MATQEEMRNQIALQTQKIQQVDPEREFEVIKLFQTKWHGRVLFELHEQSPRRFGELKREVPGISNAVLSSVLHSLEEKNLITRTQFNEIPPRVEYALTEQGVGLLPVFYEMLRWEEKFLPGSFE